MMKSYPSLYIYMTIIILSTIIIMSSNNFFYTWMGFELSMFGFLPLFSMNISTAEAVMKYFLMQTSGSVMYLMSFLMLLKYSNHILILSMMMKLGIFPFFHWMPVVMISLTWYGCLILTTLQKIGPLIILMSMFSMKMMIIFSISGIMISSLLGFNQTLMKPLMAYSSIAHTSWMILTIPFSMYMFISYMFFYFLTNSILFFIFNKNKTEFIFKNLIKKKFNTTQLFCLIILSGIPPFSIFFFKMNIFLFYLSMPQLILVLLISTYISTYYYLSFIIPNMMKMNKDKYYLMIGSINMIPMLMIA